MKIQLKIFLFLCLGTVLIYSGCKKSGNTTNDPSLTPQVVANEVALNISASLFGGLGAFDVSGGLNAPTTFAVHTKGKVLQSLTNPDCGLVVDTTLTFNGSVNDTSASISGTVKFSFICTNNVVTGYSTNDNLTISYGSPQLSFVYKIGENFTLLAVDPQNANSNISITGTLNSSASYQFKTGTKRTGTQIFNYTLHTLIISPDSDILSGSASFVTTGTGPNGVWNYQGTITFLGNHAATVTIGGKTYNVTV